MDNKKLNINLEQEIEVWRGLMIDNKTAILIGEIYYKIFTKHNSGTATGYNSYHFIKKNELSKFLYEKEFDDDFIILIEKIDIKRPKRLEKFIRELNSGRSLKGHYKKNKSAGKYFLKKLAESIIFDLDKNIDNKKIEQLKELLKKNNNKIKDNENKIVINEDKTTKEELELEFINKEDFIKKERIVALKDIESKKYDLRKLIKFCEEINICYKNECFYAVSCLARTILNHVPPVFNKNTFKEVANNYKGGNSFKEIMQNLQKVTRKISDKHLHKPISSSEELINDLQIEYRPNFDVLICEIIDILKKENKSNT